MALPAHLRLHEEGVRCALGEETRHIQSFSGACGQLLDGSIPSLNACGILPALGSAGQTGKHCRVVFSSLLLLGTLAGCSSWGLEVRLLPQDLLGYFVTPGTRVEY